MTNELTVHQQQNLVTNSKWNRDQIELIKRTICKGASDDQLLLFEYVCQKTALDPFIKQIYGIVRQVTNKQTGQKEPHMTIQTSIDGLRLIADRTGNYLPGREPTFVYGKDGSVFSATSYIKKYGKDGQWHEIAASAIYSEYKPAYANDFWSTKPHIMLSKCAEALALRKAFPAEMCGVYTKEEMDQADVEEINVKPMYAKNGITPIEISKQLEEKPKVETISLEQANNLRNYLAECDPKFFDSVIQFIKTATGKDNVEDLPLKHYDATLKKAIANREEFIAKQMAEVKE